jgi:hypothetical protein
MKKIVASLFALVVMAGVVVTPAQAQHRHRHCYYRHHHRICRYN